MKHDLFEVGGDVLDAQKVSERYGEYQKLGGIINEKDFRNALTRAENMNTTAEQSVLHVKGMVAFAGIELQNAKDTVALYAQLRGDAKPKGVAHHYSQMGDVKLFAEVLRMVGDTKALDKLIDVWHTKGRVGDLCPICEKPITQGQGCR